MTFEAAPTLVKKSQIVIDQVLERIQNGQFPPGSRLPSERDIALQINVSRTVVREALREALDISIIHVLRRKESDVDITKLLEILSEMREKIDQNRLSEYLDLTLDLHLEIAKLTENSVLSGTVGFLIGEMKKHFWLIKNKYSREKAEFSYTLHEDLVNAISNRDFDACMEIVEDHYQDYPLLHVT
jgi:GntR family transcriptional repressor for pyruvate dehydrogenase complex